MKLPEAPLYTFPPFPHPSTANGQEVNLPIFTVIKTAAMQVSNEMYVKAMTNHHHHHPQWSLVTGKQMYGLPSADSTQVSNLCCPSSSAAKYY